LPDRSIDLKDIERSHSHEIAANARRRRITHRHPFTTIATIHHGRPRSDISSSPVARPIPSAEKNRLVTGVIAINNHQGYGISPSFFPRSGQS
jgi:hypothetical protein